jgi:hypothetical protein
MFTHFLKFLGLFFFYWPPPPPPWIVIFASAKVSGKRIRIQALLNPYSAKVSVETILYKTPYKEKSKALLRAIQT